MLIKVVSLCSPVNSVSKNIGSTPKVVEKVPELWYNIKKGADENDRRFQKHGGEKFELERAMVRKRRGISCGRTSNTYLYW
jgi:hypothetical protein